jgi:hypothetical protein
MSKIQWEYDLVERPFCEQLKAMGWQWIEGDTDVPPGATARLERAPISRPSASFGEALCPKANRRTLQRDLKGLVEKGLSQGAGTSPTDPNRVYSRGPVLDAGSYDKL